MSSSPKPTQGVLLHRLCPSCDLEILEDVTACPDCGSKLIEVRDEVDTVVGTVIDDRFEVRAKVGQGGMGTVYRAWQKSVGREVAIKLIDRSYSRDAMAVRRFLREARLASQLSQPNTVSVFDFGQAADGRLFIAMELIRGRTLHEVVQIDGAFSVERCVRIGIQICDALEAAHALGIVHRDLKLENVIVLDHPPGRDLLKVLDFGLAKNIHDPGSRATESGIVVGTPRYMSPESATSGITGPPGDLYSLGVILGELALGKPMWTGETLPELIAQKLNPRPIIARMPAQLRPLFEKLLDPAPENRLTAEQTRKVLAEATTKPASDDVEPNATANLEAASPATGSDITRQLTPENIGLAPTATPMRVTPAPSLAATGSSSTSTATRPPARRWPLAVLGIAVVGVVTVAIVLATRGVTSHSKPAAVRADASAVAMAADAPIAEPPQRDAPAAVTAPAMATIHVTSEPAGASVVYRGETKRTPFDLVIERGAPAFELTAKLPGHTPATVKVTPDGDKPITLKLRRQHSDEAAPF